VGTLQTVTDSGNTTTNSITTGTLTTTGAIIGGSNYNIVAEYSNRGRINLLSQTANDSSVQLAFLTNGGQRMTINKGGTVNITGNLGIGTSSPVSNYKTHILGVGRPILLDSSNAVSIAKISNSSTGNGSYNGLDLVVNSTSSNIIKSYGMPLLFSTSDTSGVDASEKMRLTSDGKLGVGTSSPSQGLHVVDSGIITSEFESSNNSSSLIEVSNNAGLDAFFGVYGGNLVLRLDDYTANHFSMDSNGNVVLTGTLTGTTATFSTKVQTPIIQETGTNSDIKFKKYDGTDLAVISGSSSNFLIGTTTDSGAKATIAGQAGLLGNGFYGLLNLSGTSALADYNTANKIVMQSQGSTDGLYTGGLHLTRRTFSQQGDYGSGIRGLSVGTVLQDNALELYTSTNTEKNATRLKITSTGNVGIGTASPQSGFKLDINGASVTRGDIYLLNSINHFGTGDFNISAAGSNTIFKMSGSEKMRLTSAGKLGISETIPEGLLHVYNPNDSGTTRTSVFEHRYGVNDLSQYSRYGIIVKSADVTPSLGITNQTYNSVIQSFLYASPFTAKDIALQTLGGSVLVGLNATSGATHAKLVVKTDGSLNAQSWYSNNNLRAYINASGDFYSNRFRAMAGSQSYPPISFDSANKWGFWYSSGLNVITNQNIAATFTTDGDLGLGVTSPSKRLHVYDTTSGIARLETNQTYSDVELKTNNGTAYVSARDGHVLLNRTGGNNVGIGTDSPSTKLHLAASTSGGLPSFIIQDNARSGSAALNYISLTDSANATHAKIGYLSGLNTEFTLQNLVGNLSVVSSNQININSGSDTVFLSSSSEKMRFTSAGRLGIGTTSPLSALHAFNGGYPQLNLESNAGSWQLGVSTGNDFAIRKGSSGSSYPLWIDSSENVGIGTTSPQRKLHLHESSGSVYLQMTQGSTGTTSNDGFQIAMGASQVNLINRENGPMLFDTNNSTKMSLLANGNLLIGTTSDSGEKLQVNGSITISDIGTTRGINRNNDGYNLNLIGGATTTSSAYIEINGGSRGGVGNVLNGRMLFSTGSTYQSSQSNLVGDYFFKTQWNGGSTTLMKIISSNGNVLIGTTTDSGAKLNVQGSLQVGVDDTGYDVTFYGDTSGRNMLWDASLDSLLISSEARLRLGGTNDFWIYHDGTDSQIINRGSGDLIISGHVANGDIRLINQAGGGASNYIVLDGSQETVNIYQNTLIGTTTDSGYKLDVNGNVRIGQNDRFYINNANVGLRRDSNDLVLGGYGGIRFLSSSTDISNQTERMRILSNGRIGIGTNSPNAALDIQAGTADFRLTSTGQNRTALANTSTGFQISQIGNKAIYFETNGSERMRLTSTGRLGIGVTSPDQALHVESSSDTAIKVKKTGGNYIQLTAGGAGGRITSDSQINFDAGGNTGAMLISSAGKVGIGTNSPDSLLEISSSSTSDFLKLTTAGSGANPIKLIFEKTSSEQGIIEYNRNGDLEIYNTDNDGGVMIDGSASAGADFYVANSGKVGIGNSSPSVALEIGTNGGGENNLKINSDTSNSYLEFQSQGNVARIEATNNTNLIFQSSGGGGYQTWNTAGAERMRLFYTGNLLIGTTTDDGSNKLQVNGSATFGAFVFAQRFRTTVAGSASFAAIYMNNDSNSGLFQPSSDNIGFTTAASERMRITSGGNVLIGTTNDSGNYKLKVSGEIFSSGSTITAYASNTSKSILTNIAGGGVLNLISSAGTSVSIRGNGDSYFNGGNVGIGTASPSAAYKLEVNGKAKAQSVELTNVLTLNAISTPANPADGQASIYMDSSDGAIKVKINVGGTVVTRTLALYEG